MQKLISRIAWFRRGVRLFTNDVNEHLKAGWKVSDISIEKRGFRFVCYALLSKTS